MKIDHLAIWCDDLEIVRAFYMKYFGCTSNEMYFNPIKQFKSYFLSFPDGGSQIELMSRPIITEEPSSRGFIKGIAHFDIEIGTERDVDALVDLLRKDGYTIASDTRRTGDGCYEAAIIDPEGNYVELSAIKE